MHVQEFVDVQLHLRYLVRLRQLASRPHIWRCRVQGHRPHVLVRLVRYLWDHDSMHERMHRHAQLWQRWLLR